MTENIMLQETEMTKTGFCEICNGNDSAFTKSSIVRIIGIGDAMYCQTSGLGFVREMTLVEFGCEYERFNLQWQKIPVPALPGEGGSE